MNYCLWCTSKYKEELPILEALRRKDPANPIYPFYVGNVFEKLVNVDSAVSYYNKALTLDPNYSDAKIRIEALKNKK
jgi:tetratricopeptide (TPR) repeat protein